MRREVLAAVVLGALAVSCTAFVASELSGYQGPGPTTGGCFALPSNACGSCIAQRCENPNASPPVSLQAVCGFSGSGLPYDVKQCATDPSISNSGYDTCASSVFLDGGAYASAIDTQGSAENNVKKCITDNCLDQCRVCNATVYPCGSDTVDLGDAGTCGACLYNAMNFGGACQAAVIPVCTWIQDDVASCAIITAPAKCNASDCSSLMSPPSNLDPKAQAALNCLWTACSASCQ
ncbi:MAG TPA: hypothetical protein VLM85_27610 [Polyangiaceae bacterium]|nr:hypothetical protein [Polyangiaceae bacterium]